MGIIELLLACLFVHHDRKQERKARSEKPKEQKEWANGDYKFWGMVFDKDGNPKKEEDAGYNADGYNAAGYDKEGYDREGYSIIGLDREGYDREGYDILGYDRNGNQRPEHKKKRKKHRRRPPED